ncbi:MmcQ/YjbR family DNA-binding protein [Algoriphagus sp.]|uniref:MmcQ/YjbR family DNA-binding protein n=1 Tax=Algoriphagus sp. TaxID=1872435 RepID=UPI00391D597A
MLDFFRSLALTFPETIETPHFEKTSFRVRKKIFATYDYKTRLACLKLSEKNQDLFCLFESKLIFPVPNKWGKQGWTLAKIDNLEEEIIKDLLLAAYNEVAPEKLKIPPSNPYSTPL